MRNGCGRPEYLDGTLVHWYHARVITITRTQTGVRLESRLLKVLKALATELDLSLGDLIEGIVLHAFEGKTAFSAATLKKIRALRAVYGLDLTAKDSHRLREGGSDDG
jgi:predicted DNA-binding ribbon-helix-helix protein